MDMALKNMIDVDVVLNVLKDRMQKMEKHQLNANGHLEMFLRPTKEQVAHVVVPLYTIINALRQ